MFFSAAHLTHNAQQTSGSAWLGLWGHHQTRSLGGQQTHQESRGCKMLSTTKLKDIYDIENIKVHVFYKSKWISYFFKCVQPEF